MNEIKLEKILTYIFGYLLIVITFSGVVMLKSLDDKLKKANDEIVRQQEVITYQKIQLAESEELLRILKDLDRSSNRI